jgi:anti-sigma factor RsiW
MTEPLSGAGDRLERSLHAYHDGELKSLARWRLERRLARSPELRRQLDELIALGDLVRESERPADSPDLWDRIAQRLPAIDARRAELRAAPQGWLGALPSLGRPLGAAAAVAMAVVAVALGWWFGAPSAGAGVVRWMDSGGRSVMVLEEDVSSQLTIIWLLDGSTEGAARGGHHAVG